MINQTKGTILSFDKYTFVGPMTTTRTGGTVRYYKDVIIVMLYHIPLIKLLKRNVVKVLFQENLAY